jgi:nucleotide-binding universal stress UspA family protein
VAERLKAPHSKCGIRATVSGVRIPPSPPTCFDLQNSKQRQRRAGRTSAPIAQRDRDGPSRVIYSWALKRLPLRKKERLRLEREELDAKGFVTNLERLLLASDDSANGKFAARLVGVIAGSGGKPTTILNLANGHRDKKDAKARTERSMERSTEKSEEKNAEAKSAGDQSKREVKTAAEVATTLETHPDEEKPGNVDVITRTKESISSETVAGEAHKGYDLRVVGIGKTRNPEGGFSNDMWLITKGFEGPLAVVDSHESSLDRLTEHHGRILIPVNGTEVSRRAVEIGLTLARANDAQVTALYVTRANANGGDRKSARRRRAIRRTEQAVLKDIGALADRYEVNVRSTTRANMAPDEAILRESRRGYDLIVLGRQPPARRHAILRQHRWRGARPFGDVDSFRR